MPVIRSRNLKIAASGALVLLLIAAFLLLRDTSRLISGEQLEVLVQKQLIKRIVRKDPYLYVRTGKMLYRLPVEGADLAELARRYPIEVEEEFPLTLLLGMGGIVVLIGGGLFWYLRRSGPRSRPSPEEE